MSKPFSLTIYRFFFLCLSSQFRNTKQSRPRASLYITHQEHQRVSGTRGCAELFRGESSRLQSRMDAGSGSNCFGASRARRHSQFTLQRHKWGNESVEAENCEHTRSRSRLLHVKLRFIVSGVYKAVIVVVYRCQINTTPLKKQIGCIDVHRKFPQVWLTSTT